MATTITAESPEAHLYIFICSKVKEGGGRPVYTALSTNNSKKTMTKCLCYNM